MLEIFGAAKTPGETFNRRKLMQAGGLSLFGLTTPGFLKAQEQSSKLVETLPSKPYEFVMETEVDALDKMHKVGRHRKFEIHVDEPAHLKGDDNYPQPLIYVATGLGA